MREKTILIFYKVFRFQKTSENKFLIIHVAETFMKSTKNFIHNNPSRTIGY